MKRKIVAVMLASTMVLGLAACGGGDAGTTDTTGGDDATATTEAGGDDADVKEGSSDDEKILCIDDKRFDGSVSHLLL